MILVRHGESHFNVHFNVTREDPGIVDPGLTETGRTQALAAAEQIADFGRARQVLASPYRRTLETADIIAAALGLAVTIEPLVRERAYFTCDIGSPRSELMSGWPHFEFGDLPERWWPALDETEQQIADRGVRFQASMAAREDWSEVLVVTHWGFIRALTGQTVTNGTVLDFDPTL